MDVHNERELIVNRRLRIIIFICIILLVILNLSAITYIGTRISIQSREVIDKLAVTPAEVKQELKEINSNQDRNLKILTKLARDNQKAIEELMKKLQERIEDTNTPQK